MIQSQLDAPECCSGRQQKKLTNYYYTNKSRMRSNAWPTTDLKENIGYLIKFLDIFNNNCTKYKYVQLQFSCILKNTLNLAKKMHGAVFINRNSKTYLVITFSLLAPAHSNNHISGLHWYAQITINLHWDRQL